MLWWNLVRWESVPTRERPTVPIPSVSSSIKDHECEFRGGCGSFSFSELNPTTGQKQQNGFVDLRGFRWDQEEDEEGGGGQFSFSWRANNYHLKCAGCNQLCGERRTQIIANHTLTLITERTHRSGRWRMGWADGRGLSGVFFFCGAAWHQ